MAPGQRARGRGRGRGHGDDSFADAPAGLGIRGTMTRTQISAHNTHGSEEEILGYVHRRSAGADQDDRAICVSEDIRVEYEDGLSRRGAESS